MKSALKLKKTTSQQLLTHVKRELEDIRNTINRMSI